MFSINSASFTLCVFVLSGMIHFKQKFTLNREKRLRLQKKLENWEIWVNKKRERERENIFKYHQNELFVIDYINIIILRFL